MDENSNPPPNEETTERPDESNLIDSLIYGLSLPERSARTVSVLVAGFANETAATLIPSAFRSSKSYTIFIQQSLDFMIHDIGGVAHKKTEESDPADATLARRAVGGMLDFAGMATLHLSPMTILAVVSDVAYGSSTYLHKLSEELKQQGIIDQESTIDHVSDLLEALQNTAHSSSDAFNAPPLNVEALKETIQQTRDSLNEIDPATAIPQKEIQRLWNEMEDAAAKENTSIFDIATTMTMFSMNRMSLVSRGALSTVSVAGDLIDQHVLQHYGDALTEIQVRGLWPTLSEVSKPYLTAIWNNFDEEKSTITEDLLSGKLISNAWSGISQWFASKDPKKT